MENKLKLTKKERIEVSIRSWFLQGSWNYERMQNGGWAFSMIPALKKLYPEGEEAKKALERHLEFFNTHPYVAPPILGVTLALEEERANGAQIDDAAIQGVKIGMMGPLAGIGDPVFWFTVRPMLGAMFAAMAKSDGTLLGPALFFVLWNIIRIAFSWYTQELGYKQGSNIAKDLTGLQTITKLASILGMFVMGVLTQRWVNINFVGIVSQITRQDGSFIDFSKYSGNVSVDQLKEILGNYASGLPIGNTAVTTVQDNLNQLIPGLAALLLTFFCMWLLKKKVSPIAIIFGLFAAGILLHLVGIM
ncbi:MAG: PTS system mannose/fructose/sorbose family transporter subunit IID [Streptococcaceae bacterium]|jgi:PTS system mannose-specific IID component|nr:PTS system mannose/fructose/sorbose family transporter subunit IID [Streptococcaceae bacterium]